VCHGRVGPETGFIGLCAKVSPERWSRSPHVALAAGQARAGLNLGVVNEAKEINKL